MKYLSTILIILILAGGALAAEPARRDDSSESLRAPKMRGSAPERVNLQRGPAFTQSAGYQGLQVIYQEGISGPNWSEFTGRGYELSTGDLRLTAAPSLRLQGDGRTAAGVQVNLRLKNIVSISHTSHLGAAENHKTFATVAPGRTISLSAMHLAGPSGSETRVGPSVKLGAHGSVWYGKSLSGGNDLVLATGNFRF